MLLNKKKLSFFAMLMLIIFVKFLRHYPAYLNMRGSWNNMWCSWSYRYGFIRRGFIGTIIDFVCTFFKRPLTNAVDVYGWITVATFTIITLITVIFIIFKQYQCQENQLVNYLLILLFICGPGWETWYQFYGSQDTWLIVLSIMALFALRKNKFFLVLIISICCVLIHEAYVFMYFNCVIMGLAIAFFLQSVEEKKKKVFLSGLTIVLVISILFIYLQFFSHAKDGITLEYVLQRTKLFTHNEEDSYPNVVLNYLFSGEPVFMWTYGIKTMFKYLIVEMLFMIPFAVEIFRYWKAVIVAAKSQKNSLMWFCIACGIITELPLFIMHTDYGRWFYSIFFYEIATVLYINSFDFYEIMVANKRYLQHIMTNPFYYCVLLAYLMCFGPFIQNPIHGVYDKLFIFLDNLLGAFP